MISPTISITLDELFQIEGLKRARRVFSCQPRASGGRVWADTKIGYNPEPERTYISESECPKLHEIVDVALDARPEGGRFHIEMRSVFWAYDGEQICALEIT